MDLSFLKDIAVVGGKAGGGFLSNLGEDMSKQKQFTGANTQYNPTTQPLQFQDYRTRYNYTPQPGQNLQALMQNYKSKLYGY